MIYILALAYFLPAIILIALLEYEQYAWTSTLLVVASSLFGYFYFNETISFIKVNYISIALYLCGYAVAGFVWSFARWALFLIKYNRMYKDAKEAFLASRSTAFKNLDETQQIPKSLFNAFEAWCKGERIKVCFRHERSGAGIDSKPCAPVAKDNKANIVAWGTFWPFSMAGYVLNDPIRKFFEFTFNLFSGSYQRLSNLIVNHKEFEE